MSRLFFSERQWRGCLVEKRVANTLRVHPRPCPCTGLTEEEGSISLPYRMHPGTCLAPQREALEETKFHSQILHTHTHSERSEQATPRLLQECTNQRSPVRNSEGRGGNRNIKINTQQETDVTVKCAVPLSLQSRTERNGRLTSPEILTLQC